VGPDPRFFLFQAEGLRMLGLPENVRSTLRTLGAFKDAAGQTWRATARRAPSRHLPTYNCLTIR